MPQAHEHEVRVLSLKGQASSHTQVSLYKDRRVPQAHEHEVRVLSLKGQASSPTYYPALETSGYVERKSRFTHDGSLKHFWSLTKKGLKWGENQVNPNNPRETQPLFFVDKFVGLYEGLLK